MLNGKYEIHILLSEHPFPPAEILPGADNIELPAVDPKRQPGVVRDFTHYLYFYEKDGEVRGVHQTELSKQLMDELHIHDNVASWKAFSGSEGVDLWQYTMVYNEVTNDVAGVCFGTAPLFRGYIVFSGKRVG